MYQTLMREVHAHIRHDVPLAAYTTFGVGGSAEQFVKVDTVKVLREAVAYATASSLPLTVLGGGSNVLVSDKGIAGLVLHIALSGISFTRTARGKVRVRAAAGELWDHLVARAAARGWWGIENLSGIPGHVGAAPLQNINAYGVSIADTLESVEAYHLPSHTFKIFSKDECRLRYRDSFFKSPQGREYVITAVTLLLSPRSVFQGSYQSSSQSIAATLTAAGVTRPQVLQVREAVMEVRRNIGMLEGMYQSAGSFFKNVVLTKAQFAALEKAVERTHKETASAYAPWHFTLPDGRVKVAAAFLMECTPYNKKNFSSQRFRTTVSISPLHTLSIINAGGASADDIRAFARVIQKTIADTFHVHLEPEVCYL